VQRGEATLYELLYAEHLPEPLLEMLLILPFTLMFLADVISDRIVEKKRKLKNLYDLQETHCL